MAWIPQSGRNAIRSHGWLGEPNSPPRNITAEGTRRPVTKKHRTAETQRALRKIRDSRDLISYSWEGALASFYFRPT